MIHRKQNPNVVNTVQQPAKITDITAPAAFCHIKQGHMAVDAMHAGLINAYELALYNSPAGLAYHIVNIFEQEGLDVFIGTQQIDTLLEQGILEAVAALNKVRKQVPEFLAQVNQIRAYLQTRDAEHIIRLCSEVVSFANSGKSESSSFNDTLSQQLGWVNISGIERTNYFTERTAQGSFNDVFWTNALSEIYGSNLLAKVRYMKNPESWPNPAEVGKQPAASSPPDVRDDNPIIRTAPFQETKEDDRNPTPEELVYGKTAGEMIEKMTSVRSTSLLLTLFADELYSRRDLGVVGMEKLFIDFQQIGSDSFEEMMDLARSQDKDGSLWVTRLESMKVDELTELMLCHYKALSYFVSPSNRWKLSMAHEDYLSVFKTKLVLEAFPSTPLSVWKQLTEPRPLWE
jgi:hypothetical protein